MPYNNRHTPRKRKLRILWSSFLNNFYNNNLLVTCPPIFENCSWTKGVCFRFKMKETHCPVSTDLSCFETGLARGFLQDKILGKENRADKLLRWFLKDLFFLTHKRPKVPYGTSKLVPDFVIFCCDRLVFSMFCLYRMTEKSTIIRNNV